MGKITVRAVLVLLAGLTCDSKCYAKGEIVTEPGPELLQYAQPGVVHWTGGRAARFADEGPLEVDAASPQGEALPPGVSAPPGSVVILHEGLTADSRVWHRNEVVRNPGPELLAHCEPGVVHWATLQPAARLVPGKGAVPPLSMISPDPVPLPEKAKRMVAILSDLRLGMSLDELRRTYEITKGEARLLGLDTLSSGHPPEHAPVQGQEAHATPEQPPAENPPAPAPDQGQEAPPASEPDTQGQPEDNAQEAPQEPSGEVKDQF